MTHVTDEYHDRLHRRISRLTKERDGLRDDLREQQSAYLKAAKDRDQLRSLVIAYVGLAGNTGFSIDRTNARELWERATKALANTGKDTPT